MSRVSQRTNERDEGPRPGHRAAPARLAHRGPAWHECGRAALQGRPVELLDRRRSGSWSSPFLCSSSRGGATGSGCLIELPPLLRRHRAARVDTSACDSGQSPHDEHHHETLRPGREQPDPDRGRRPLPGELGLQPRARPGRRRDDPAGPRRGPARHLHAPRRAQRRRRDRLALRCRAAARARRPTTTPRRSGAARTRA